MTLHLDNIQGRLDPNWEDWGSCHKIQSPKPMTHFDHIAQRRIEWLFPQANSFSSSELHFHAHIKTFIKREVSNCTRCTGTPSQTARSVNILECIKRESRNDWGEISLQLIRPTFADGLFWIHLDKCLQMGHWISVCFHTINRNHLSTNMSKNKADQNGRPIWQRTKSSIRTDTIAEKPWSNERRKSHETAKREKDTESPECLIDSDTGLTYSEIMIPIWSGPKGLDHPGLQPNYSVQVLRNTGQLARSSAVEQMAAPFLLPASKLNMITCSPMRQCRKRKSRYKNTFDQKILPFHRLMFPNRTHMLIEVALMIKSPVLMKLYNWVEIYFTWRVQNSFPLILNVLSGIYLNLVDVRNFLIIKKFMEFPSANRKDPSFDVQQFELWLGLFLVCECRWQFSM